MNRRAMHLRRNPEEEFGAFGTVERRKNLQKNSQLLYCYGITLATYRIMKDAQGGVCAICKQPETGKHNRGSTTIQLDLTVDHDHDTGNVRQLLCSKCNKGLGIFQDNTDLLMAAADYLRLHKQ